MSMQITGIYIELIAGIPWHRRIMLILIITILFSLGFHSNSIQVEAQVHHPFNTYTVEHHTDNLRGDFELPEILGEESPYHPQLDARGRKPRKLRRRRKKQQVILR